MQATWQCGNNGNVPSKATNLPAGYGEGAGAGEGFGAGEGAVAIAEAVKSLKTRIFSQLLYSVKRRVKG